jgi:hypothetical protein
MKTFEEWRQSGESWEWPAGEGEPDIDTMLRRAWNAGVLAEQGRIVSVLLDIPCEAPISVLQNSLRRFTATPPLQPAPHTEAGTDAGC